MKRFSLTILSISLGILFINPFSNFTFFESSPLSINTLAASFSKGTSTTAISDISEFKARIEKASETLEETFTLSITNYNHSIYAEAIRDFNFLSAASFHYSTRGNQTTLNLTLTYSEAFRLLQSLKNETAATKLLPEEQKILQKASSILTELNLGGLSDFEKEVAIHNYIVNTTTYDYERFINDTLPPSSYRASGVFFENTAVCQGYTEAFQLLLALSGIESKIVTGYGNGQSHAWNMVLLEDEWYMVDVTFDDPVIYEGDIRKNYLSHEYFNVTSDVLSKTHTWDATKWPVATGSKYQYYKMRNTYFTNYENFKEYITEQIRLGEKEISCYVEGFSPSDSLDFVFNFHQGSISYIMPSNESGIFTLYLN